MSFGAWTYTILKQKTTYNIQLSIAISFQPNLLLIYQTFFIPNTLNPPSLSPKNPEPNPDPPFSIVHHHHCHTRISLSSPYPKPSISPPLTLSHHLSLSFTHSLTRGQRITRGHPHPAHLSLCTRRRRGCARSRARVPRYMTVANGPYRRRTARALLFLSLSLSCSISLFLALARPHLLAVAEVGERSLHACVCV